MICKGSIEEEILQTLEMRKDYTDYLFKEKDEWYEEINPCDQVRKKNHKEW